MIGRPEEKDPLDELVRAASDRAVDADAIHRATLARIDGPARAFDWLPDVGPYAVAGGCAAMLLAAGFAGYNAPLLLGPGLDDPILGLALGTEVAGFGFGGIQ